MMPYEDIFIQLVDTPPVTEEIIPPGLAGTLRNADMLLVLIDAASDECLEQLDFCLNYLKNKKIVRETTAPGVRGVSPDKILVLASKADQPESAGNLQIIKELGPAGIELWPFPTKLARVWKTCGKEFFKHSG